MNIKVTTVFPTITSYPTYASLLSITDLYLQTDYEQYMNWFMLQFINTIYFEKINYIIFDNILKENTIEYCEIIEREVYNGVWMQQKQVNFSNFFIEQLEKGYAIFIRINQKYIPQLNINEDFNHEVLITEYNSDEDCFTIWDFFNRKRYDSLKVSRVILEDTLKSFERLNHPDSPNIDKTSKIIAFKRKKCGSDLRSRYEPRLFVFLIERWLTGDRAGDFCHGSICYDFIINNIQSIPNHLDARVFHVLYDHKIALEKTVDYLMKSGKICYDDIMLQEIDKLKDLIFTCRNVFLKHNLQGDIESDTCKERLLRYLMQVKRLDRKVFTKLYKAMSIKLY